MNYQQRRHPYAVPTGRYSPVGGLRGLADATFNPTTYDRKAVNPSMIPAANNAAMMMSMGTMGSGYWDQAQGQKVFMVSGTFFVVGTKTALTSGTYPAGLEPMEFTISSVTYNVWQLYAKAGKTGGSGNTGTVSTTDCPPPENCQERLVNKTVYVSARPVDGAIEIPVAYKKYICEGDSVQPPEINCDELLNALKQAVSSGDVPGMTMQGLGLVVPGGDLTTTTTQPSGPEQSYAPDWCKDCREVMVKATAYVTDKQVEGAVPFNVKMKVLVCETSPDPTIDCDQVVQALQAGFKAKKWSALNGLSSPRYPRRGLAEAVTTTGTKKATSAGIMPGEPDFSFDTEATRLSPSGDGSSFPWWAVAIAAAGGLYFLTK